MTQYNIRSRIVSNQVISLNSFWATGELATEANVSFHWRVVQTLQLHVTVNEFNSHFL